MSQSQSTLFGSAPAAKKAAKAKTIPLPPPAPKPSASPLTAAQKAEATKNRNALRAARNRWQIGDTREAESDCPACDEPRLAVLEDRNAEGGQTWVAYCVNRKCVRCPDHGLENPCR